MNKFFLMAAILFSSAAVDAQDINYRPYISTRMAKILLEKDNIPDDSNKLCDGSGWITHGDGHKTECPGCDACKDNQPNIDPVDPVDPEKERCQCGCGKIGCKCEKSGQCFPIKDTEDATMEDPRYYIYHFGADWCSPCIKMKQITWSNSEVKKTISDRDGELHFLDADTPSHKEFFEYYNIKLYPTVIIVKADNLENPIFRMSGYISPETMNDILQGKLENDG